MFKQKSTKYRDKNYHPIFLSYTCRMLQYKIKQRNENQDTGIGNLVECKRQFN